MSFQKGTPYDRPEGHKMGDQYFQATKDASQSIRNSMKRDNNGRRLSECRVGEVAVPNVVANTAKLYSPESQSTVPNPIKNEVCKNNRKKRKAQRIETVKLNDLSVNKLTSPEGVEFLQKLSNDNKVQVQVIPQTKNKKFQFACIMEGGQKQGKRFVKNAITNYCQDLLHDSTLQEAQSLDLIETFQGHPFTMDILETSLIRLENPNVNWIKLTFSLHKKIKQTWGKYNAAMKNGQSRQSQTLSELVKQQYIALHSVLLGKLNINDAVQHKTVLKEAVKNRRDDEIVRNAYNYIFCSSGRLDINYHTVIKDLPPHMALKDEIDALRASANEICAKNNLTQELNTLNCAYNNLLYCHYSERKIFQFKKVYDEIKAKDVQC